MSGIYIHIPFCRQACSYCDFYFVTKTDQKQLFVHKLIEEIFYFKDSEYSSENVETIYFGGGTPSQLSGGEIEQILTAVNKVFGTSGVKEITFEMNPDDVNTNYLNDLKNLGITRASMGVQSFHPDLLSFMHRAHNREDALHCLELLEKSELQTYSVDLIYGNPNQTEEDLEEDIHTLMAFEPPHVSAYSLTIEPRTRLGKLVDLGRLKPLEDDIVGRHFDLVSQMLSEHNIHRYEVSNFARKDHEAIHNSNYWEHKNYLGFGPAAHSFWRDDKTRARRWQNKPDLSAYLANEAGENISNEEYLPPETLGEERIMLGLRTIKGVSSDLLTDSYQYPFSDLQLHYIEGLNEGGFLKSAEPLILNDKGLKLADHITLELISRH